jgi:hypothetical protein
MHSPNTTTYPGCPWHRSYGLDRAGGVTGGHPRASVWLLVLVLAAPLATWAGDLERFAALAEAGPLWDTDCLAHNGVPVVLTRGRAWEVTETVRRTGRVIDRGPQTIVVYTSNHEGYWGDTVVAICAFRKSAGERAPSAGD